MSSSITFTTGNTFTNGDSATSTKLNAIVNSLTVASTAHSSMFGFDASGAVEDVLPGQIRATATNDSAAAGRVGEYAVSTVTQANGFSLTTATNTNITSVSLTAGDWDVWGVVNFDAAGLTGETAQAYVSTASAAQNQTDALGGGYVPVTAFTQNGFVVQPTPAIRLSLTGATTVYLGALAVFSTGTITAYGTLRARRAR